MTLDEMKKIAKQRTQGEWTHSTDNHLNVPYMQKDICNPDFQFVALHQKDFKFIEMAANNWGKLMRVVEAAKKVFPPVVTITGISDLNDALKALEET